MPLRIRRAYDPPAPDDGCRVLVDRLWPRGLKRETAGVDRWLRELAPSNELRTWFAHDPARWDEFRQRYAEELQAPAATAALAELRSLIAVHPVVTLLYAARDTTCNNAEALRLWLEAGPGKG
ncbi:DUF488 domain-containing protein [Thauera sp.]|jgi:uncharacterized protein YeaO (DUF488 family)|uniref:DUF488 domain-containing protein n=1 Tax=Thauera sp. TaxID=1905334 RepID=UPI002A361AF3|nr:DUF488 family protein [Thauera sp.]MDX9884686.1 DUF488 family protein [Thauera sp.]